MTNDPINRWTGYDDEAAAERARARIRINCGLQFSELERMVRGDEEN